MVLYKKKLNFAVAGSYSNAGATGTVVDDTTNGVLTVTAPMNTTTRARVTTAAATNMPTLLGSNFGAFRLKFTTATPNSIKTLSVYISLDTAYTVSGYFKVSAGNFILGLNEVVLGWDDFVPPAGKTVDDFKMAQILSWQVSLASSATEASTIGLISFDGIQKGTGAVVFMADDGNVEQFTIMHQLLQNAGFLGAMTVAIIPAKINTPNYMTAAQLKEMNRAGCTIGNHTFNHVILGDATEAVQRQELSWCYDWLNDSGLGNCPDYIIYPQGNYNQATLNIVRTKYVIGRTVKEGMITPTADKTQLKIINLLPGVTFETVKKYIDRATTDGVGVIFLMHRLMENEPDANTPTTFWVTRRLKDVVDYARMRGAPVMNLKSFVTTFLKDNEE